MSLRQAAQQALEALESGDWYIDQLEMLVYPADDTGTHEERAKVQAAITALRAALVEPEKNPFGDDAERYARKLHEERESCKAIFTASTPQPEQPVAHLWQHGETGRTRIIGNDEVWTASNQWFCVGPLYLGSAPNPRKESTDES